jgi:hypothetical protein
MNFSEVILFVALGAMVGFGGGRFAIGGALIAIPLLSAGFSFTQHDSQGTAMVMALASACVTLAIYVRKRLLRVRDSLLMIACSAAFGLASSQWVRYVNDGILQRRFGVFLIVLAILVWFGHLGEGDRSAPLSNRAQAGVGSLAGALSGLFVVGGALVSLLVGEGPGGIPKAAKELLHKCGGLGSSISGSSDSRTAFHAAESPIIPASRGMAIESRAPVYSGALERAYRANWPCRDGTLSALRTEKTQV